MLAILRHGNTEWSYDWTACFCLFRECFGKDIIRFPIKDLNWKVGCQILKKWVLKLYRWKKFCQLFQMRKLVCGLSQWFLLNCPIDTFLNFSLDRPSLMLVSLLFVFLLFIHTRNFFYTYNRTFKNKNFSQGQVYFVIVVVSLVTSSCRTEFL